MPGTTLANAYLQVRHGSAPGAGIVGSTIQFHGTADRYTLNGATSVATLYSNATTATANPAVTLRSVGVERRTGGGVHLRPRALGRLHAPGKPGLGGPGARRRLGIRPDDLFYGAKAGDVQPDWIDTNKIAIPQADEQQRLLLNLITLMERDKLPLPRFWYLPRGEKAAVVMSGDDHSPTQAPAAPRATSTATRRSARPGARRQLGLRPLDVLHLPERDADQCAGRRIRRRGVRGRGAPARRLVPDDHR